MIALLGIKSFPYISIIESITEFLPVSSTAHIRIFSKFLNISPIDTLFLSSIQMCVVPSLLLFYKTQIYVCIKDLFIGKFIGSYGFYIIISSMISMILGFILSKTLQINGVFVDSSNLLMSVGLIVGGILMIIVDKYEGKNLNEPNMPIAIVSGIIQSLAIFPGVSRLGAVILGARIAGLSHRSSVDFGFITAIPMITVVVIYDIIKRYNNLTLEQLMFHRFDYIIAFLLSMFLAWILIPLFKRLSLSIFGYYRIIFGLMLLYI